MYSNTCKLIQLNGTADSLHALFTMLVWSIWLDIGQGLFLCVFTDRDKVEVNKNAKQGQGTYPALLTAEQAWLRIYYTAKRTLFLHAQRGKSVYCETFRSKTMQF